MPYEDITISVLCRQATVSRNTFYRLFDAKADVLRSIITVHAQEAAQLYTQIMADAQQAPTTGQLYLIYQKYFAYWEQYRTLLSLLTRDDLFYVFWQCYNASFTNSGTARILQQMNV